MWMIQTNNVKAQEILVLNVMNEKSLMIEKSVNFVQKIAWIETVADKSQCVECKPDYYKFGDECFDGFHDMRIAQYE